MWERIQAMRARFEEIEAQMATPEVARNPRRLHELARERSQLEPLISMLAEYRKATDDLEQAREVLAEADDEEFRAMAQSEIETLSAQIERLGEDARRALLPKDPNDERNVIIEIRAGTGGDEAGLWAGDLYRAYSRYADAQHWKTSVISANTTPTGGFKEIVFQVNGKGAFSRFKYESGVHRVQRVPATEAQGRIHTSTATVAVLPEVEDLDFTIDPSEIRMDRFHSGGAGGQNVNKVETGIRLTHEPTGIAVTCTDDRSQLKNRIKAMSVLKARLYDLEMRRQEEERSEARRSQVGRGQRAEKIRTYNFPENRVTDHRIGLTVHSLATVLQGELDYLIDSVATDEEARLLEEQTA